MKVDEQIPYAEAVVSGSFNHSESNRTLIHPLEAAIINGNLSALHALVDSGADVLQVPTQDWIRTPDTRTKLGPIVDIYSFIPAKVPNPALGPLMSSYVTQATMSRRIHELDVPPTDAATAPVARRRARLV